MMKKCIFEKNKGMTAKRGLGLSFPKGLFPQVSCRNTAGIEALFARHTNLTGLQEYPRRCSAGHRFAWE